jgi:hypothetical protein
VGEPARASPRAPSGGACDEGGWLRDVGAPGALRRGLVVTRRPPCFGWHRGASGAGAGACRVSPSHFSKAQVEQVLWQEFRDHGSSLNLALNEVLRIHGGPAWCIFQVRGLSSGVVVSPLSFLPCFHSS